jgi:hypothetical protein
VGTQFVRANLDGASLDEAHLSGVRLDKAHLVGALLRKADLECAFLRGAHLEGAQLRQARLESTYLVGAHLQGASLENANLEGAQLASSHLEGAELDLEGANLGRTILVDAWLCRADLTNAKEVDQTQVDSAWGNDRTNLPDDVTRPCNERWFSGEAREEEAEARSRWRARQIFWLAETT